MSGSVATAGPAQPDDTLAAAAKLIGFIPRDVRYDCTIDSDPKPSSVATAAGTVRVGLACPGTDGVSFAEYYLFADSAAMASVYTQIVGASGTQPARTAEGNCPSDGTWNFSGEEAGRVGCYYATTQINSGQSTPTAEYPVQVWTYDAENILAVAAMPPGTSDAAGLQSWWNDKAGPTQTAGAVPGVVSTSSGSAHAERVLLSHVPAVTRKTCTSLDPNDPASTAVYAKRLWIRAAVSCATTGGADNVVYESIAPAAVQPYFASAVTAASASDAPNQANPKCPGTGTYTANNGKQRHTVGVYICYTDQKDANGGPAFAKYSWTYPKLGVVAFAINDHNDPDALIKWFDSAKSGPE